MSKTHRTANASWTRRSGTVTLRQRLQALLLAGGTPMTVDEILEELGLDRSHATLSNVRRLLADMRSKGQVVAEDTGWGQGSPWVYQAALLVA